MILNSINAQHFACDYVSGEPIPFGLIQQKDTVYYTEIDGTFFTYPKYGDSLAIDAQGYDLYREKIALLKDTVFLTPKSMTVLKEVVVSAKIKTVNIGFNKLQRNYNHGMSPTTEFISLYLPQGIYKNSILQKIYIPLVNPKSFSKYSLGERGFVRVHLYTAEGGDLPLEQVFSSNPIGIKLDERDAIELDVSSAHLPFFEKGLGVGIEFIGFVDHNNKLKKEGGSFVNLSLTSKKNKAFFTTKNYYRLRNLPNRLVDMDSFYEANVTYKKFDKKHCITLGLKVLKN